MSSHRRFRTFFQFAAVAALLAAAVSVEAADELETPSNGPALYKDTSLPFDKRVADLISHMTLHEKAEQIQVQTTRNNRLGIPPVHWWTEAIHGVGRAGTATVFPEAIDMASTWDPELLHAIGDAIGDEARAKFDPNGSQYRGIMLWCPTINMARDPRWGRIEETYGEDPVLTSRLAVPFIKGLQGDDPKYLKTVATPKHFAMHSEETGRMSSSYNISEKTLREYYLPAFYASFKEGHAASVMSAHNGINGIPCTANHWLLTDLLRDEWGFEGAVVSDWGGVSHLKDGHHIADTMEETVAKAIDAGLDVICDPRPPVDAVVNAVNMHLLSEKTLDQALSRDLLLRFRLGMFDPPEMVPYTKIPPSVIGSKEHVDLALRAANEGFVLLKNDSAPKGFGFDKLLPLDPAKVSSIAVIGPYANQLQFGNYSGNPLHAAPTMVDGLKAALPDRIDIRTADWTNVDGTVKAAESSDLAIVVLGLNNRVEMEGIDRATLEIPPDQRLILERIVRANPLTIVVLEGGSPMGLTWINEHVPTILLIWYPGERGAVALADILLGKVNPSGKLPLTFYQSASDVPPLSSYEISEGRTYMYLKKKPTFPFGFGLSYSQFNYSKLQLMPGGPVTSKDTLSITLGVANAGPLDGDEVVQVYTHKLQGAAPQPLKLLKSFQRVSIPNGQTRTVKIQLPVADLATWDTVKRVFAVEPGTYELQVGSSSEDIRLRANFDVK